MLISIKFVAFGQNIPINQIFINEKTEEKINYWENGQKLSEIQYLKGKREGSCKYWHKTGQLMSSAVYKNGMLCGPFISYFENGQIESYGSFKYTDSTIYSRKDGVWKYYYENGQIRSKSFIKDGFEEIKFYDKQGNLVPPGHGC